MCTTVGETFADYLNNTLGFGLNGTTVFTVITLIIALFFQFKSKSYTPALYWVVVVLISIAGTLFTDNLTDNLNVSLMASSIVWAILLAATFAAWYRSEKTLSIHSIYTNKREGFYWLTILFTFALVNHVFAFWAVYVVTRPLGAAIGDQMAQNDPKFGGWGLGTTKTSLIFLSAILILVIFLSVSKRDQIKLSESEATKK